MKSIKEKQLIVKWSKAMNEPIDPQLLEEVERYEQIQNEIIESVRMNTINDLSEAAKVAEDVIEKINLEYPKPPTLEELLSVIKEEQDELVQAQSEKILIPEETTASANTDTQAFLEVPKEKSLVNFAVEQISKEEKLHEKTDSFQQPDPTLTNKNLNDVVKKLKFLEQAIGKIAATGPGSGEVNLRWLDDINRESIPSDNSDKYLRYSQTNNNFEFAVVTAEAANGLPPGGLYNDIIVKVDGTNYNAAWKKPDTLFAYVRNAESYTINKGNAVYLYQASGDKASVKQAVNSGDPTSAKTLGLAAENITTGSLGNVITQGPLIGLNLKDFNEGDTLYLGNVSGQLTKHKPFAPEHIVFIGVVERANQGQGILYVRAQNGYELDELHNVNIDHTYSLANGHVIIYNTANSLWENNYLTTDHVVERGNLYLTNTRVVSALTAGQNISIAANGLITSNATGGGGAVSSVNGLTGTVQLYTANITESGNLYFTNARAISAFTAGQGIVLEGNGLIVSTATGTVTGVNGQTGNVSLSTSNIAEGSNLYFSNSRSYDNIVQIGYITSSALNGYATNSQLSLYATNAQLADYATNNQLALYATNSQLASYATNSQLSVYATNNQLSIYATNNQLQLYATNAQLANYATNNQLTLYATNVQISTKANISDLTTANISEISNLYFTNVRVYDNVTQIGYITPSSLVGYATNNQLDLYATNAQLATYATNAQLALYTTNVQISLKANITDLNTSNVNEGSNLYFTNSRAVGSLTAGQNISIASNGRITAEVTGGGSSVTTIQFNNTNLDFYATKSILSLNKNTFRSAEYNFFIEELGNYTRKSQELIHNGTILSYSNSSVSVGTVNVETYFYLQNNDLILQALSTSASYVDDYFLLSDGYQSNTTINLKGHVFLIEA